MFVNWTFAQRMAAGYALAGLTLLMVAVVSYRTTGNLVENDKALIDASDTRAAVRALEKALVNAETGQRGYLLTGMEAYLAPYQDALADIQNRIAALRQLGAADPATQQKIEATQPLIAAKLTELKRTIDLRRDSGLDAALKLVVSGEGKAAMDQLRLLIDQLDQQQSDLVKRRAAESKAAADWALMIILWGGLAGAMVVGVVGWLITRLLTGQIGSTIAHVQSSASELQTVANQQATGLREQASAMSEITTTISELLVTSRQIAESAQRVAQIAEQTAGGARSGRGSVDVAQDAIGGIRRQVDQIVAYMLELGKKSQQIGAVLDIVAELAEQTNILAINATIEAAGAGENGKRFAVVAEEIRKLADRVGGSTKEIRALIDDVRSAVNTTVMATETGSKAVDTGARQFGDVAAGFRQIAELVDTTTDAAREIELSTKQQSTAVEQVNVAIANIAQASHETEASAGQTLQTASELAHLSTNLARIIRPQAAAA